MCRLIDNPERSTSKSNSSDSGLDNSGTQGGSITDDLSIGDYKLPELRMGVAKKTGSLAGQLGLGVCNLNADPPAVDNSTVLDSMVANGLIKRRAYSLWFNTAESDKGNIVFGGVDTEKFEGDLKWIPLVPEVPAWVALVGMSYTLGQVTVATTGMTHVKRQTDPNADEVASTATSTEETSATESSTASGTVDPSDALAEALKFDPMRVTFDARFYASWVPPTLFNPLAELFGAKQLRDSEFYVVPCSFDQEGSIGFQFGNLEDGPVIKMPFFELVFPIPDWTHPGSEGPTFDDDEKTAACGFGLSPHVIDGGEDMMILGQAFLRSAYIAFDHDDMSVGLASPRWNVTQSNIVEITGEGLGTAVSAASVSATASVAVDQLEPGKMGNMAGNATDLGKPSAAASTLKSGVGTASKPISTGSASSTTSSAAAAAAVVEQSNTQILLLALCGSIMLVAAMLL